MSTITTATPSLPISLSGDLSQTSTEELTTALETILRLYSHTDRILAELNNRAPASEVRIYCDMFDRVPVSVFSRLAQYL